MDKIWPGSVHSPGLGVGKGEPDGRGKWLQFCPKDVLQRAAAANNNSTLRKIAINVERCETSLAILTQEKTQKSDKQCDTESVTTLQGSRDNALTDSWRYYYAIITSPFLDKNIDNTIVSFRIHIIWNEVFLTKIKNRVSNHLSIVAL